MGTGVPTYRVRVHVVDVNGAVPSGSSTFEFWLAKFLLYYDEAGAGRVTPKQVVTGTTSTGWMTVDSTLAATLTSWYQATPNPWTYQGFYDFFIADLAMKFCVEHTNLAGEIEVTETGEVVPFTAKLYPSYSNYGRVGLMSYRRNATTGGLQPASGIDSTAKVSTLYQYHDSHYKALAESVFPTMPPALNYIHISDTFAGGDSDRLNELVGWQILRRMGVDVAATTTHDPHFLGVLAEAGIARTNHEVYYPPNAHHRWMRYTNGDLYGAGTTPGIYTQNAQDLKTRVLLGAGFDLSKLDHISIADEPFEYGGQGHNGDGSMICGFDMVEMATNTQGSQAQAMSPMTSTLSDFALTEFRNFLAAQGLTPADFGVGSWSSVNPVGQQPTSASLATRKLWYWTARWLPYDMAVHYAGYSAALRTEFGTGVPITFNLHNGAGRSVDAIACIKGGSPISTEFSGCFDWFEMSRLDAINAPSFADYTADSLAWMTSLRQHRLDEGSRRSTIAGKGAMYYTTPHSAIYAGAAVRKLVAALGHGANKIRRYRFGPVHAGADGYAERTLTEPTIIQSLKDERDLVTAVEADLYPTVPIRPATVGVIFPRSAQAWDGVSSGAYAWDAANPLASLNVTMDYQMETHALAWGLQALAIPYKWLEEEDCTSSGLASYKAIYLASPNVPAEVQTALANWVSAGGNLWLGPGTAHADRYDTASTTLKTAGGMAESSRTRIPVGSPAVPGVLTSYTANGPGGNVFVIGAQSDAANWRTSLAGTPGTAIATWSNDGSPALIKVPHGSGFFYKAGFFAGGTMVRAPFGQSESSVRSDFDPVVAAWIGRPVTDLSSSAFKRQVEGLPFKTEAMLRASSNRCMVHLVRWQEGGTASISGIRIRPVYSDGSPMTSVASVSSYRHGSLAFTQTADGITLDAPLSLQYADILTVTPSTGGATVPGAPTMGTATASSGSATFTWSAPASDGGSAVTGYQLKVYRASDDFVLATQFPGNVLSSSVGVGNGTAVYGKVAAINAVGTGPQSAASNTVTPSAGGDTTPPSVTITQAAGQADPASTSPINFTATFSESVTGFTTGDVTLSGTAGATTATVTGSGATYNVAVSGMTGPGTVVITIAAGVAQDAAGNANLASTNTDNTVTYSPSGSGSASDWITGFTPGNTRGEALAWVGLKFTVGASNLTVTHLARWVVNGGATHTVKLVNAATGVDVPGASASINTTGAPTGAFKSVALTAPVTLTAGQSYFLVNSEPGGGDIWLDYNSTMVTTSVATSTGAVYNTSTTGGSWVVSGGAGANYVGLNFRYEASGDTTPPTVTSRVVNGSTLTVTYDEPLDTSVVPPASRFTVKVNSVARTVTNVTVGNTGPGGVGVVTLTLASPVVAGQTVTLSYSQT